MQIDYRDESGHGAFFAPHYEGDAQVPDMLTDFGGSPDADQAAHVDAWPKVVRFLRGT